LSGRANFDPPPFSGAAVQESSVARTSSWGIWDRARLRSESTKNKRDKNWQRRSSDRVAYRVCNQARKRRKGPGNDRPDLANSFCRDRQFLQALLLVSELEARLVTVITFWNADGFAEARERKMARLRQKLQPYLDQSLRMQSFSAHLMDGKTNANEAAMLLAEDSFSRSEERFSAAVV